MKARKRIVVSAVFFALVSLHSIIAAETLEQLIAGAKKEPEFTFIAGAQTFGGQRTFGVMESWSIGVLGSDSQKPCRGDPVWSPIPEGRHGGLPLHRNVMLIQFGIETYDE